MRNGVKTLVRQELDCSVPVTEFKLRDVLYGEWTVGAIDVLPWAVYYGEEYPIGASIRLRLHGDWRLALHERPSDDSRRKPVDALNIFFEPALFHNLLVEVFRVPFEGPEDYLVDGRDAKYDGVRVFQGRIYSPDYYNDYRARESDHLPPPKEHWWDQMSLLVTDSDPQYFCLGIALGTKDRP